MKTIEVKFIADVADEDFENVKRAIQKVGSYIITQNFPKLQDVGYWDVKTIYEEEDNTVRYWL